METDQKELPLSVAPVLTIRSIVEKLTALDREVNYLMNKAKIWKPTKKVNETRTDSEKKTNETIKEKKSNETAEEEVKPEQIVVEKEGTTDNAQEEAQPDTPEKTSGK